MKHIQKYEKFDPSNTKLKYRFKEKVSKLKKLKWVDIRNYLNRTWEGIKRESNETKQAAKILERMIDGKEVSDNEKKFLREQSKDLIRIISTGVLPIPITAILVALGKRYNFKVLPGNQEELKRLIEKEKDELGIIIDDDI
jgi:hypothetical protein